VAAFNFGPSGKGNVEIAALLNSQSIRAIVFLDRSFQVSRISQRAPVMNEEMDYSLA
jgi:hypothetical protein